MAKSRDSGSLDSFTYVQAIKHATERTRNASGAGARASPRVATKNNTPEPGAPSSAAPSPAAPPITASHSALPAKRRITCYNCGYSHTATGQLRVPYCPKCRTVLVTDDLVIDSPHKGDALTIGDVTVLPGASFESGAKICGRNIKIGADISAAATLTASESMILAGGAKFGGVSVSNAGKTLIPAGEKIEIAGNFDCAEIEIAGALRANIRAERGAVFRAGSVFYGTYVGPCITVEDGAIITAGMRVGK